jgi:AcrR family transcriptional regulator
VAKAGRRSGAGGSAGAGETRQRIVDAAIETLKRDGFAGASARAMAATGGFNQALIFYHFGSVNGLLLAALDETSARRLERYRDEVASSATLPDLVQAAGRIYREDVESGHIKVLAEVIAAASASPWLGPEIAERIRPWTAFAREAIDRVLSGSPLAQLVPSEDLAHAVVALYLGMELLTHLEDDRSAADALFQRASALVPLVAPLLGMPS